MPENASNIILSGQIDLINSRGARRPVGPMVTESLRASITTESTGKFA